MKLDRRTFIEILVGFSAGAGAGILLTPVNWKIMPEFQLPLAFRRGAGSGPAVVVMAPRDDCFAVSTPYQGESHYSLYLSLFGRDIKAGESATARKRARAVTQAATAWSTVQAARSAW